MTTPDDSFSCGCEGRSGIPLTRLKAQLRKLNVDVEHPVRGFLPTLEPSLRNTVHSLKTTVMSTWAKSMDSRASISLKSQDAPEGVYNAIAHVSGFDADGQSLSAERYSISLKFDSGGRITDRSVISQVNGSPDGVNALLIAIDRAEQSLSSKQWQGRWNAIHAHYRSVYLTSMNYYVHSAEGAEVIDLWITIAQRCGIRAIRYDQPQWAVAETLGDLLKQKLEEAEKTLKSDKRTTVRTANSRLASAVELGETIQSLKSILGDVGERMAQSLETLKSKWSEISSDAKQQRRVLQSYTALTHEGKAFLSNDLVPDSTYICISQKGLDALPKLGRILPSLDPSSDDAQAISILTEMSQRPRRFEPADLPILRPLISEGWCLDNTIDTPVWHHALQAMLDRPQLATDVNLSEIPAHYTTLYTRSFKE